MNKQPPSFIDVEASGFGSASYPIEVGVKRADGARFCRLIYPLEDWTHWDAQAESLHGISQQDLYEHGYPIRQVCNELNQFLEGQTVYTDGWVVDYPWLIKLFDAVRLTMAFKVTALDYILNEQQMENWHLTKESLQHRFDGQRHRASADAELIQLTFLHSQAQGRSKHIVD